MQRVITRRFLLTLLSILTLATFAWAQTIYTPKAGSTERKAMMDAIRIPVEKELGKKAIFKVDHLKVSGSFAFMRGVPLNPNGSTMDYRDTKYWEAKKEGMFDDSVCALLKKKSGKWKVIAYAIGPTDVAWDGWDKEYGAPSAIFR